MAAKTTRARRSPSAAPSSSPGSAADRPRFFAAPDRFRAWLDKHHATAAELWVGFHKRDTGKASITWPQSVDEALCFGWIDGVRKSLGDESYVIRFTPRRSTGKWSAVNIKRMAELEAQGRVTPAGRAAFARLDPKKSAEYSYERRFTARLEPEQESRFRANRKAWSYFESEAPWYRRTTTHWVVSAKREETRERRLATLIDCSARGRRIEGLERPGRSK
jgi:uncharacterized protein YdeI (YjbR/CyaY-like superfamily)